jgi:hypothetical protein
MKKTAKLGRPTKFNLQVIPKIDEYIATTGTQQMCIPTIEGFARYIGVNVDTVRHWQRSKINTAFSASIKKILDIQKEQLMNDGLYGGKEVNSTMAIFLLKVNHGMIETNKQEITGELGIKPILGGISKNGLPSNNGDQEAIEAQTED